MMRQDVPMLAAGRTGVADVTGQFRYPLAIVPAIGCVGDGPTAL